MSSGVTAFRDQCAEIANESEQSTQAFYQLGAIIENEMPDAYRIPYDVGSTTLLSSAEREKHYRGLWYELVQHLADLTYLNEKEFIAFHQHRKHVQDRAAYLEPVVTAIRIYLQEDEQWPQLQLMRPASGVISLFWVEQHLGDLVDRIGQFTALDGSLAAPAAYAIGELSCYGRAMAFRLRTLLPGMQGIDSVTHLTGNSVKYVANILNQLQGSNANEQRFFQRAILDMTDGQTLPARVWELTGNIDELYKSFQSRKTLDEENNSSKNLLLFYETSATQTPWETPNIKGWITKSKRSTRRLSNELELSAANTLGTQLLQIKLWQTSFYVGEIDGLWGPVSHNALVNLLEREHEFAEENRPRDRVMNPDMVRGTLLRHQTDAATTYAVNLNRVFALLEQYSTSETTQRTTVGTSREIDEDLDFYTAVKQEAGVTELVLDRRILQEQIDDSLYPDVGNKPRRRVAYPRRSFLAGLWRGIKKIGKWLKRVAQKLLGPIFGFVKYMLARVRRGVQLFFTGFKYLGYFLLGKPIVTPNLAAADPAVAMPYMTKFSLDFDAVNFFPLAGTSDGTTAHSNHLKQMKDSMFYFIDVVLWVIRAIGKLSQPGGWVWLGLQLLKEFKKLIVSLLPPLRIA